MLRPLLLLAQASFAAAAAADAPQRSTVIVRGAVRDRDSGRPLAGVELLLASGETEVAARSDAEGKYQAALPPGVLSGRFGELPKDYARPLRAFPQPLVMEAGEPVALPAIELARGRRIDGKVVDAQGRAVAAAEVRAAWYAFELWMDGSVHGPKWMTTQSDGNGQFVLTGIDHELRYKGIVRDLGVRLFARRADHSTEGWQTVPRATEAPVTLRIGDMPAVALGGQVYDLAGRPVAGAKVTIWTKLPDVHPLSCGTPAPFEGCEEVCTGADGRFQTPRQLPRQGRYRAVVAAEGFLPAATAWRAPNGEAHFAFDDLRLRRLRANLVELTSEPRDVPAKPLKALPANVLPRDEELAIARRVLQPFVERAFTSGDESAQWSAMFSLCEVDPAQALERLDCDDIAAVFKEHRYHFFRQAAKSLFHDSPDESRALAEAIDDAGRRIKTLLELAAAAAPDEARELLARTVLTVAAVPEPTLRAIWWSDAAGRYLDLGDARQAGQLLERARAVAPSLPLAGDGGYARGRIADPLARLDLAAALELIEGLEESWMFDRRHGNVAHRIARERPADAERVLDLLHDRYQRGVYAVRVCHRMAPVDHERAARIAQAIDSPYQKAYALGRMAQAYAAIDAEQARLWLDQAFSLLDLLAASHEERFAGPPTAAALLPAVEAVDPRLVREYLWRTLAMRPAQALPPHGWRDAAGTTATVAMLVARYDRELARSLLQPLAERARDLVIDGGFWGGNLVTAAAMIDPRWAEEIVESLSDERGDESESTREQCRQQLARLLACRPQVRWRRVLGDHTGLWVVGAFDNAYYAEF